MKFQIFAISVVFLSLILLPNFQNSFGHGLGTETMPPIMIDGIESTLQVASTTSFDTGIRQITINLFETESSGGISNVSFEVVLIKNDQQLFKNNFERDDGILIMNLVPSDDSDVQIINQETVASFLGLASDQFNLKGSVFENGGLYMFNVKILTVNNYNNLLSEPVEYELGISIPETTYYEINDENFGTQELGIITYFDQITEFNYDQSNKQIKFSFPFDWDQKTIDQTTVIHEEVIVSKTFGDLLASSFTASLNGIALPETAINVDDFSGEKRTIHVVVTQSELQEIFSENNYFGVNEAVIKIEPVKDDPTLSGVTENGQFKIKLWWEGEIRSNANLRLGFDVLDTFLKDRPISVPYELSLFSSQKEVLKKAGVSTGSKTQSDSLEFFIPEDVSGILVVKFENLGGNKLANAEFPLAVNRTSSESTSIPAWIKNNAGWWADGQIPDSAFVQGIQFLIKEGIIIIEQERTGVESLDLTISSPPKFEKYFGKYVDVFGVPIYATSQVTDGKVLHAANVLAQYLDNDADGTPDNPLVVEKLKKTNSAIPLFANEWEDETSKIWDDFSYVELYCWTALYADETNPRYGFDAALEEILHMITQCGYANAYPQVFGENPSSQIAEIMDNARGGFFDVVPNSYPRDAWYTYDDYTCDYSCMITEYFYWTMTSILGAQEDRGGEISREWELHTKELVMEKDPDIYALLTDPQYKLPTVLPDGNYQG